MFRVFFSAGDPGNVPRGDPYVSVLQFRITAARCQQSRVSDPKSGNWRGMIDKKVKGVGVRVGMNHSSMSNSNYTKTWLI